MDSGTWRKRWILSIKQQCHSVLRILCNELSYMGRGIGYQNCPYGKIADRHHRCNDRCVGDNVDTL
jgi:hypothetical protein